MCGSAPQSTVFRFEDKDHVFQEHKILQTDLNVLSKWVLGALARRRFTKLVLTK